MKILFIKSEIHQSFYDAYLYAKRKLKYIGQEIKIRYIDNYLELRQIRFYKEDEKYIEWDFIL